MNHLNGVHNAILNDLKDFNISIDDIDAREITVVDVTALNLSTNVKGYKIPYNSIKGMPINHYRIRQLPDTSIPGNNGSFIRCSKDITNIYFPLEFSEIQPKQFKVLAKDSASGYDVLHTPLFIVDDERLATQIIKEEKYLSASIQGPTGWKTSLSVAEGFRELCEKIIEDNLTVLIWIGDGADRNVQREISNMAMELKFQGVPFKNIRQIDGTDLSEGSIIKSLGALSKFPKHPNIRSYIQEKIGDTGARLTRRENSEVALAVLADMESRGTRIRSTTTNDYYYFDRTTKELVRASLGTGGRELMENSDFMSSIYTKYGLSPNDSNILKWLSTQFMAEEPIYRTKSYKVMMCEPRKTNTYALQLTPSEFVYFGDSKPAQIRENGDFGILFERSSGQQLDIFKLKEEINAQRRKEVLDFWWHDVVKEIRLTKTENFKIMLALLYYVSPWLKGWKEMQLPIEVVTGEAGTGKSSIFSLRLNIISGDPSLKGLPDSVKGWHTEVVNTTGICVFDNVHLANKVHKQALSDEMSRIVTEPHPTISMRQLYKTAEIAKMPVNCTFALTSIENVFTNIDFLQRSIVIGLDRPYTELNTNGSELLFGSWVDEKLHCHGGREAWLAHHIVSIERFFKLVDLHWNNSYKSKTRLINFEQSLIIMGKVFGLDISEWLPELIRNNSKSTAIDVDWILEGLYKYVEHRKNSKYEKNLFSAKDISDWAICNDDFDENSTLTNPRRLGRYINSHKTVIRQTTGLIILDNNKKGIMYAIEANTQSEGSNKKGNVGQKNTRNRSG
jgi:hypothetical protein